MAGNNGTEQSKIIKTQDENGKIYNFEFIDILEFEGQEYGLLMYLNEENNDVSKDKENEEEEVVIMKLIKNNDSYIFETIDDDKEFEKIVAYLEAESEKD